MEFASIPEVLEELRQGRAEACGGDALVAVMLGAVLFDRQALTLRSVAIAALIVMVLRPESLVNPGFQMSFAATTALVAVFNALRGRGGNIQSPPHCARGAHAVQRKSLYR